MAAEKKRYVMTIIVETQISDPSKVMGMVADMLQSGTSNVVVPVEEIDTPRFFVGVASPVTGVGKK